MRVSILSEAQRAEARELYASGLSQAEIGRRLGVTKRAARWATNGGAENMKPKIDAYGRNFMPRLPRRVRRVIAPPECVLAAARAFAAREISRNELMLRITYDR